MSRQSAGLLVYRLQEGVLEVLLVHPGGPFWKNKDLGAWSIPKGEFVDPETPLAAARREFQEELGLPAPDSAIDLGQVKQKAGKIVHAFAAEADLDLSAFKSNAFSMEWPPKSGRQTEFPEVDRAEYYPLAEARRKINPAQAALLDTLEQLLAKRG
ncbi:MAG TPA: NUDIX domain-containing protein [Tepidisphaeraceae bacterium]